MIRVDKPNMAQKGTVSIEKTGEVFSGVNISGEENADVIYQPVYEVKGLAGAVYEITAAEDIITPDGTLRYAKGEVVDTVPQMKTDLPRVRSFISENIRWLKLPHRRVWLSTKKLTRLS